MTNSFETFYFKHSRKLYFYAEKKISDVDAARHIVDDAFITNQDTILHKDETTALKYMYTTVRCDCIDWLRKRKSTPEERLAYELWASQQPDLREDPEEVRSELLQRLMDAIEKLTPREKEVVRALLADGKGKDWALKMGIAETTFSNTKGRALGKLFALLRGGDAVIFLLIRILISDDWKN